MVRIARRARFLLLKVEGLNLSTILALLQPTYGSISQIRRQACTNMWMCIINAPN